MMNYQPPLLHCGYYLSAGSYLPRTKAYNYMSGCFYLAVVSGSALGSLLLSHHVYILNALSIFGYIFTACLAATIPSHCGREVESTDVTRPLLPASTEVGTPGSTAVKLGTPHQVSASVPSP